VADRLVALFLGQGVDRLDERQAASSSATSSLLNATSDRRARRQPFRRAALDREHAQAARERLAVRVGLVECVHLVDRDSLATIKSGDTKAHASPVRDVGVFAGAAARGRLAVGETGQIATVRTGLLVDVGMAPRVGGHAFLR